MKRENIVHWDEEILFSELKSENFNVENEKQVGTYYCPVGISRVPSIVNLEIIPWKERS